VSGTLKDISYVKEKRVLGVPAELSKTILTRKITLELLCARRERRKSVSFIYSSVAQSVPYVRSSLDLQRPSPEQELVEKAHKKCTRAHFSSNQFNLLGDTSFSQNDSAASRLEIKSLET
jgi:hypothetical protein